MTTQAVNDHANEGAVAHAVAEVLRVEREWAEAHVRLDVEAIERLMHPDYFIIRPDGGVDGRESALAAYRSHRRHWDVAQGDNLSVRVYGDTAVVVGRWRARGRSDGQGFNYAARYVAVWVRYEGHWRIVSDQSTEIK